MIYLPLGYGDGLHTSYSGAKIKFRAQEFKILGRINMDLMVLYTPTREEWMRTGADFELWGSDQSFDLNQLADSFKTIPYQLLTGITSRVSRRYIN